jgi:hypothetical protein
MFDRKCLRLSAKLAILGLIISAASPAHAADPAYVGKWGATAAQCKVPQDRQGAPMILKARGYDQHEAHCTFVSVKKSGAAWNVAANCSVQGDQQKDAFALRVTGNTLKMISGRTTRTFKRCT